MQSKQIHGFTVYFNNEEELGKIIDEVFVHEEYAFRSQTRTPQIIDAGSHIGIATLYFKSIYPDSVVTAFEPDPDNFKLLQKNIAINNLRNVTVINAALSDTVGMMDLYGSTVRKNQWTWGNTIVHSMYGDESYGKKSTVPTVKLSNYLIKTVDFLKMDIEGMEERVLKEIEHKLHFINEIVIEYHHTVATEKQNDLQEIHALLKCNSFSVGAVEEDLTNCFPKELDRDSFIKKVGFDAWLVRAKRK